MPVAIINCPALSSWVSPPFNTDPEIVGVGDADPGVCMTAEADGKVAALDVGQIIASVAVAFHDDGFTLPPLAVVNSVTLNFVLEGTNLNVYQSGVGDGGPAFFMNPSGSLFAVGWAVAHANPVTAPSDSLFACTTLTTDPRTGNPWLRDDCFTPNVDNGFGNVWPGWYITVSVDTVPPTDSFSVDWAYLAIDYVGVVSGSWYLHPTQGYEFFDADPGAPWVVQAMAPSLNASVLALQQQQCPWFLPTYIIRLTDPAKYATLVSTYGLGSTPIILGLAPNDAVTITGAPLNTNPSNTSQSVWPQVYVDPAAPFVLGVGISLADGGGTVAVSYATPFGRPCTSVLLKWQALVVLEPLGVTFSGSHPAPAYTSAVVPALNVTIATSALVSQAVPDGAFLTGGPGFGNNGGGGNQVQTGPCGCPPE